MWFYAMIVILLVVLVWITRVREGFVNMADLSMRNIPDIDPKSLPDPQEMFKKMRALLDKYDKPDVWGHATDVMDKDPGQLARMNLGILNGQ